MKIGGFDLTSSGVIKNADVNLQIDKGAIASNLRKSIEGGLLKMAEFSTVLDQDKGESAIEIENGVSNPDQSTVRIHTDRLTEQLELLLQKSLETQAEIYDASGLDYFAKIVQHDDGGKYHVTIKKSALENFMNRNAADVDGIIDRSDIPADKDEVQELAKQVLGMDGESGKVIIDGQNVLKLLQAISQGKYQIEGDETVVDKSVEQWQKYAKFLPGLEVTADNENVQIEFDMERVRNGIKNVLTRDLNRLEAVNIVPNGEAPATIEIKIDYKKLADQTMQVVADQLMSADGVRIDDGHDITGIQFSTNMQRMDEKMHTLEGQISSVVNTLGKEIAGELDGQKPSTLISSVQRHFLKQPPKADQQVG